MRTPTLPQPPLLLFDQKLQRRRRLKFNQLAGLDEVGRGPLAGPVVACALILQKFRFTVSIRDSKQLSALQREAAYRQILPCAQIGIGFIGPEEIDRFGIQRATDRAMVLAVEHLPVQPKLILVDGTRTPRPLLGRAVSIVDGDAKSFRIACASIVAKVIRDRMMTRLHRMLPHYGFDRHKGYGTPEHLKAIRRIGPSFVHRFSFQPVGFTAES